MSNKLKLISALVVALGSASPALAQAFNPGDGTGSVMPQYFGSDGSKHQGSPSESNTAPQRPLYNYAPSTSRRTMRYNYAPSASRRTLRPVQQP
jgi:hypothetical protein